MYRTALKDKWDEFRWVFYPHQKLYCGVQSEMADPKCTTEEGGWSIWIFNTPPWQDAKNSIDMIYIKRVNFPWNGSTVV